MSKNKKSTLRSDGALKGLLDKIRASDRGSLICMITGAAFLLLGIIQLILVLFLPTTLTFDHISIIVVDFIIAAFCLVFVLYRSGKMDGMLPDEIKSILHSKEDVPADAPRGVGEADVRPAHPSSGMAHRKASGRAGNAQPESGAQAFLDESFISPGHRFSPSGTSRMRPDADGSGTRRTEPHSGSQQHRFNSRDN